MMARILLVGVLAIAAITLLSAAIHFAAPYLAALVVLGLIGGVLFARLGQDDSS
jgi:hypothetical protein